MRPTRENGKSSPTLRTDTLPERTRPVLLELRARSLDQRPVVDAGRAHCLAGPAVQALVHLLVEFGIEQVKPAVGHRFISQSRPRGDDASCPVSR